MDSPGRFSRRLGVYLLLALTAMQGGGVNGHSWIDELTCESGPFSGANSKPGYIRKYVGRQSTNIDQATTNRILDISSKQMVCPPGKEKPGQNDGFPKLVASPGALVKASYLENGHIWQTLDGVNGPKAKSGTVWVYGTQNPKADRDMASILKWNGEGTGGDKQGKLLSVSDFDDLSCIEVGHENAGGGHRTAGPCATYFRLPSDAQVGKDYTVYWLWDYTWHFGPPKPGYIEWYSSCMDIEVKAYENSRRDVEERSIQVLPLDSAPVKGLNRHLRREQLRQA